MDLVRHGSFNCSICICILMMEEKQFYKFDTIVGIQGLPIKVVKIGGWLKPEGWSLLQDTYM